MTTLSGGERNRLLLARLFAQPANLLVLDEPTNDLDIETLELLEEMLQDYPGTLLLVSHDRAFLDNVVTQTLVARRRRPRGRSTSAATPTGSRSVRRGRSGAAAAARPSRASRARRARAAKRGLTYKEQRELDALPGEIEALEARAARAAASMCAPRIPPAGPGGAEGRPPARRGDRARARGEVRALGDARRQGFGGWTASR